MVAEEKNITYSLWGKLCASEPNLNSTVLTLPTSAVWLDQFTASVFNG